MILLLATSFSMLCAAVILWRGGRSTPVARNTFTHRLLAYGACWSFLASTLTWRARSTADLIDQPVDAAAGVRLILLAVAVLLALLVIRRQHAPQTILGPGLLLFAAYTVVVMTGSLVADLPWLVVFRGGELGVMILVAIALAGTVPVLGLSVWAPIISFVRALGVVILIQAVAMPSRVWLESYFTADFLPVRLTSYFPVVTANSVGLFGTILVAGAAIGSRHAGKPGFMRAWSLRVFDFTAGFFLVVASQYRTGYLILACMVIVVIYQDGAGNRRRGGLLVLLAISLPLFQYGALLVEPLWFRGSAETVRTLSGRTEMWSYALQLARDRPLLGHGLSSGIRSNLHFSRGGTGVLNTWVEVLVGTGILGFSALALAFIVVWWGALRRPAPNAPILFLLIVTARSMTGQALESASIAGLLFLAVALSPRMPQRLESSNETIGLPASERPRASASGQRHSVHRT